jgi:hypothetical protein
MAVPEQQHYEDRKEFRQLQNLLAEGGMTTLVGRHRIGQLVEKLNPSGDRHYGENAMLKLTGALAFRLSRIPSRSCGHSRGRTRLKKSANWRRLRQAEPSRSNGCTSCD